MDAQTILELLPFLSEPILTGLVTVEVAYLQSLIGGRRQKQALSELKNEILNRLAEKEKQRQFHSNFLSYFMLDLYTSCDAEQYQRLLMLLNNKTVREASAYALASVIADYEKEEQQDGLNIESLFIDFLNEIEQAEFKAIFNDQKNAPFFPSFVKAYFYAAGSDSQAGGNVQSAVVPVLIKKLEDRMIICFEKMQEEIRRQGERLNNFLESISQLIPKLPTKQKVFEVLFIRNNDFTGREVILEQLADQLIQEERAAVTQTFIGQGGVGKTQIALEYAYRHQDDYRFIGWVQSETNALLNNDLEKLGKQLFPETKFNEPLEAIAALLAWAQQNDNWLLIYDNAENPESINSFIPKGAKGHIIITSRHADWSEIAVELPVKVFDRDESVNYIKKRRPVITDNEADKLADAMGDFPLALSQACSYMKACGKTVDAYLELFEKKQHDLLDQYPPKSHEKTVAATFTLAFDCVREESELGGFLLSLFSFFAPDEIPLMLLRQSFKVEEIDLDNAIAALQKYSLAEVKNDLLSLHRLVQTVIRETMPDDEKKQFAATAVNVMRGLVPFEAEDVRTWDVMRLLYAHALTAAEWGERLEVELANVVGIYNQLGAYNYGRIAFTESQRLYEKALPIYQKVLGKEHSHVATVYNNLGSVLRDMDKFDLAQEKFEQALEIDIKANGPNHPDVATSLNNLGGVLGIMGDLAGAKKKHEQALKIRLKKLGEDHPDTATSFSNLGSVLLDMGDLAGAKKNFEKAIGIDEKASGPDHPEVATDLLNLGSVLQGMGDFAGAKEKFEQAIEIDKNAYGPDHPEVATDINDFASLLVEMGQLREAKPLFERALDIRRRMLGSMHSHTIQSQRGLVDLLYTMGDLTGEKEYYEQALKIDEEEYGPDHPFVATDLKNLGGVLQKMGDLAGAKEKYEQAIKIDQKAYGSDHFDVATDLNNLAILFEEMGQLNEAKPLYERALDIFLRMLGPEHPHTIRSQENLADLLRKMK